LEKIKKGEIAIVGKIGMKKKIEIAKKAKEKGIPIHNLNVNKMLKKIEKKKLKTEEGKK
jgi:ribosomal protein L32E